MRILSGIQPSGSPHLGNYFAMMQPMIDYQRENELFCFIASYHSLTTTARPQQLSANILEIAADFLALGLNAQKSFFWVQSDLPEVTELTWLLSMHIKTTQLELAHSYKDKISQGIKPLAGLFLYPVLMTADILAFGTERVPVGRDQKQHLEICRDIAIRFNHTYGETFVVPEADIRENIALLPGTDGNKMSKSYNNAIYPFAAEKELKKSIMSIVTDSRSINEPKEPYGTPLYEIYSLFLNPKEREQLADRFRTPGTGYGQIKQELFQRIMDYFSSARKQRAELLKSPEEIRHILTMGAEKARQVAAVFLQLARQNSGLQY